MDLCVAHGGTAEGGALCQLCPNPMEDFGPVTVGDLNSDARGSGARRNGGKPQWFQFPFWAVIPAMNQYRANRGLWDAQENLSQHDRVMNIIGRMADWQRGGSNAELDLALAETLYVLEADLDWDHPGTPSVAYCSLVCMVRVLEFGAKKYKIGNWAKGMPWNTAFTCTMSHLLKYLAGQIDDEESKQHTLAHAAVNIAFLIGFKTLYPEGDDRIKEFKASADYAAATFGELVEVPGAARC